LLVKEKTMSENYDFDLKNLPETHAFRGDNGMIAQIREPCYHLLSPCFLGRGTLATFFDEGETVRTFECPNHHMQPLNRAAGERYSRWLETQAVEHGVKVSIEDLTQAAMTLSSTKSAEEISKLDAETWTKAVHKLAVLISQKRNDQLYGGLRIPDLANPTSRVGASKAPPMAGLHYTDPSLRSPAQVGPQGQMFAAQKPEPTATRVSKAGKSPLGGNPQQLPPAA
jgi:hypothetical protein